MASFKSTLIATTIATQALFCASATFADSGAWSNEPVRIIVTFSPGGTSDLIARLIAQHLDADYGQKAVVDNRPGAGGTIAADYVAQQAPDGTTLILANNAPFTIAPTQFESLPYHPMDSFTHIARLGTSSPGLMVQPSLEVTDVPGFVKLAQGPGVTYGSSGVGSITHILGEAVDVALGIESIHIPYKGAAPAIQDFRAGVLDAFYDSLAQNSDMIESGGAIAIAIGASERNPQTPDVPTFKELGYDIVVENWTGLSGPTGMDPAIVEKIHDSVNEIMALDEVKGRIAEWGITAAPLTTAEYSAFVADTIEVWQPLIIAAGIQGK